MGFMKVDEEHAGKDDARRATVVSSGRPVRGSVFVLPGLLEEEPTSRPKAIAHSIFM
jgi:hypothetical protein